LERDQTIMKYLVTGVAGFIGSHLAEALVAAGHEVVGLDNLSTGKLENMASFQDKIEFYRVDIRDFGVCMEACQGVDYVLHQAALGSVPRSIENAYESFHNNASGTLNMLIAAKDAGVKRFVYASSSSVYGEQEVDLKDESLTPDPLSPYAATKYTNEIFAKIFYKQYGLETIGLRYFNVYGPRQDADGPYAAVIPRFIKVLRNNEGPIIFGDGEQIRDFTYVSDVVEANLKACAVTNPSVFGKAFNISGGAAVTINQLLYTLQGLHIGKPLVTSYRKARKGDVKVSVALLIQSAKYLSYEPQVNLFDGLNSLLEWESKNA